MLSLQHHAVSLLSLQHHAVSLSAAASSSTFSDQYPVARVIDGRLDDIFASSVAAEPGRNWVAVRVPASTRVGPVALYNRRDDCNPGFM